MRLFLSYNFDSESFIQRVNYYLGKQKDVVPYCYSSNPHLESWVQEVGERLSEAEVFILFVDQAMGKTQIQEAMAAIAQAGRAPITLIRVDLPEAGSLPDALQLFVPSRIVKVKQRDEASALGCAREITQSLDIPWIPDDDLPSGYPFDYEKSVIDEYVKDQLPLKYIAQGCPAEWPQVIRKTATVKNPIDESDIGLYRDWDGETNEARRTDSQVLVAALSDYHAKAQFADRSLTFPEAGPRKLLHYPTQNDRLTVGLLVSGGIAPGINAVIAGLVQRQLLYAERGGFSDGLTMLGYQNGLSALHYSGIHAHPLTRDSVAGIENQGGSILGTSRIDEFISTDPEKRRNAFEKAIRRLADDGVEILYVIGGNGSMRAAHALWKTAQTMSRNISVVGIPKTMDNDILWVWQSFGFLSAVERSKEAIQQLHTEAVSNPRLCVIQLFGSDSGFVVSHAALASGVCDLSLIPEEPFRMTKVSDYIKQRLRQMWMAGRALDSAHGVIVMAETAIPLDAEKYFDDPEVGLADEEKAEICLYLKNHRVFGQTPDALRSAGLKLVSRVLQRDIRKMEGEYWQRYRVFTNEPRHLIRAIAPSSSDAIFAQRLGTLAVDGAMAGYTDFMISQWLTEYVMVPLRLVALGRKRIPRTGIFLKSVRANTGQPADLT